MTSYITQKCCFFCLLLHLQQPVWIYDSLNPSFCIFYQYSYIKHASDMLIDACSIAMQAIHHGQASHRASQSSWATNKKYTYSNTVYILQQSQLI